MSSAVELDKSLCNANEEINSFNVNDTDQVMNENVNPDLSEFNIDISDVVNYPQNLTQRLLERIIITGPIQTEISFPVTNGRSFSAFYNTRKMPNEEKVKREWLIYSKSLDSVHCFCCRIFQEIRPDTGIGANNGMKDWGHLSQAIKKHE